MARYPILTLLTTFILLSCGGSGTDTTSTSNSDPVVDTDKGRVRGKLVLGVLSFKGIPYAKPPIGNLRWKAPQPVDAWPGERSVQQFGSNCAQIELTSPTFHGSEDCLTLNVFAPVQTPAALSPVFVYLHGGGNMVGSGDMDLQRLAALGPAVIVTVNYRLGPFGFLAHSALAAEDPNGSTGNYAILDQIAALQWVQRNIQRFGGDPRRVMLGGHSAGAHNTAVLIASPLAKNLFSSAAVMSHSWVVQSPAVVANTAQQALIHLGCNTFTNPAEITACLRSKPAALVATVPGNGTSNSIPECAAGCRYNLARVDGYVLPGTPLAIVRANQHNAVPVMVGTTEQEWTTTVDKLGSLLSITNETEYLNIMRAQFGNTLADQLVVLYPSSAWGSPLNAYIIAMGDINHHCPARSMLDTLSTVQTPPVYQYLWAHGSNPPLYAGHGEELPYFLQTYSTNLLSTQEAELATAMSQSLTRFNASGSPTPTTLTWPAYQVANPRLWVWETPQWRDPTVAVQAGWRDNACDLLDGLGFTWEYFTAG